MLNINKYYLAKSNNKNLKTYEKIHNQLILVRKDKVT